MSNAELAGEKNNTPKRGSKAEPAPLNYSDRDPAHLGDDLKTILTFHDVIGEPEPGVFSNDGVYKCSYNTYTMTKLWCYRILAYTCNVPLAVFWALWFGCFSYTFIWVCVPFLRCCRVQCRCIGELNKACLDACIGPFCDAFGRCLGQMHVRHSRYSSSIPDEPDPAEKRDAAHLA